MENSPPLALGQGIAWRSFAPRFGYVPLCSDRSVGSVIVWADRAAGKSDANNQRDSAEEFAAKAHLRFFSRRARLRIALTVPGWCGSRQFFHVDLLALVDGVGRIHDDPVSGIESLKHFERSAIVAADGERLEMRFVIGADDDGAKSFRTE